MTRGDGPLQGARFALGFLLLTSFGFIGCGERSPSAKVYRIEGADAAWNASRMLPGRAVAKSEPVWEVEAEPGDVLGLRILAPDEQPSFGFQALTQGYADLYYPLSETSPTSLPFRRRGFLIDQGETLVGVHLDSDAAQAWMEQATAADLGALRFLMVENDFPSLAASLPSMDTSRMILQVGPFFDAELLHTLNVYGFVRAGLEPVSTFRTSEASSPEADDEATEFESGPENGPRSPLDPRSIAHMTNLRFLILEGLDDLSPLSSLTQIRTLILPDSHVPHLEIFGNLSRLEALAFDTEKGADLAPLVALPQLSSLWVMGPAKGLEALPQRLTVIALPTSTTDEQLRHLVRAHPGIQSVIVSECDSLTSLAPLVSLSKLHAAYVNAPHAELDLTPIGSLRDLNMLSLIGSRSTEHFAAFHGLQNLRRLIVDRDHLDQEEVQALIQALPDCDVVGFCMGSFWIVTVLAAASIAGSILRRRRPANRR